MRCLSSGAPIDGFGVGTALDVSSDAPSLDCAYKLQEYAGKARRKRSKGKATWPGRKQVYRKYDDFDGCMAGDIVALEENDPHDGQPLIMPVMQAGKRINPVIALDEVRLRTLAGYERLPRPWRAWTWPRSIRSRFLHPCRTLANRLDRNRRGLCSIDEEPGQRLSVHPNYCRARAGPIQRLLRKLKGFQG